MRIRLTLDIQRHKDTPPPDPDTEPPVIYDLAGVSTERAGWQPIGFTTPGPRTEEDA